MGSGISLGLSSNPIKALPGEGAVLLVLLLFRYAVSTIILNDYGRLCGRSAGPVFQRVSANRKQEVWQSPEELQRPQIILFV